MTTVPKHHRSLLPKNMAFSTWLKQSGIINWWNDTQDMTKPPQNVLELPLAERGLMALKAAVEKVIEEHAREGLPLYIWRAGKVVAVPVEELRTHSKP